METVISARKPFGDIVPSNNKTTDSLLVYAYPQNGYINRISVSQSTEWIDKYKVFVTKAYGERGDFPYFVIGKPFIGNPNEILLVILMKYVLKLI